MSTVAQFVFIRLDMKVVFHKINIEIFPVKLIIRTRHFISVIDEKLYI